MRVSDSERQRAIEELRRHCAAGRLDVDEYASRLERAMAATTLEELDDLRADLPMVRIPDPERVLRPGLAPLPPASAASPPSRPAARLRAVATVLAVAFVLIVVLLSLVVSWTWAAVLLGGWLIGLAQGRLRSGWSGGRP